MRHAWPTLAALAAIGAGVDALASAGAPLGRAAQRALRRPALRPSAARMMPLPIVYPARGFTAAESSAAAEVSTLLGDESAPKYVVVSADDPIGLVASELSQAGRGASAIVQDGGIVVGIFTERDYLKALSCASDNPAEECIVPTDDMTLQTVELFATPVRAFVTPAAELITVEPSCTIVSALRLMGARGIRHLPVIKPGASPARLDVASLVGVLSIGALADWVQRDSEMLQSRFIDRLSEMNPRFRSQPGGSGQVGMLAAIGVLFATAIVLFTEQTWITAHWQLVMVGSFVLGYVGIIFEELFDLNKGAVGLLMATLMWAVYIEFSGMGDRAFLEEQLSQHLAEVSDICFFLLAASTIVEVVDAHQGFRALTDRLQVSSKSTLFWLVGVLTFFLSAILNNLTVTIVMVSLMRKLLDSDDERKLFGAMIVIAANAGGVWTPIGDVTTTMLWMNGQLSTAHTITDLFACSLVSLIASMAVLQLSVEPSPQLAAGVPPPPPALAAPKKPAPSSAGLVLGVGVGALLSVPVFVEKTGLPPFMGMLTGLGALWVVTDALHAEEQKEELQVPAALSKLDTSGILFFLGVLMAIGALDASGLLKQLAVALSNAFPSDEVVAAIIGVASALIDNVPLVAATMGMYDMAQYPQDAQLWQLIAYCAGTGGSILVIGSASGVALMGLESVDFIWYLKKASFAAAVGYAAGIAAYLGQGALFSHVLSAS